MTEQTAGPPTLPVPRHPSPLSFSSAGDVDGSGPEPYSPVPSVFEESEDQHVSTASHARSLPGPSAAAGGAAGKVPITPESDSIVFRTTLKQLESQTVTLKRLAKTVLSDLAIVAGLYDQLDRAEDELLGSLGELARCLGTGYGLDKGVWDDESAHGVRRAKRERRHKERQDLEVMVQHGVEGVRAELKRKGLAGGGATSRYEKSLQGYYTQTGAYLTPASHSQSTHSLHHPAPTSDKAQLARTAQMDALSYQHHSALLYAVPPSSPVCLDLLVSLYTWAGTFIPPSPPGAGASASLLAPAAPMPAVSTVGDSLATMASIRSELLHSWSLRESQQSRLEERAARRQAEMDGTWNIVDSPAVPQGWTGPVSSTPAGSSSKPKRGTSTTPSSHKANRSVGGRLRDFLSPSTSSYSLAQATAGGGGSRASLEVAKRSRTPSVPEHAVLPTPTRPELTSRHSVQLDREYHSPIITSAPDTPGLLPSPPIVDGGPEGVGRKHEGVLWSPGTWEGLGRPNPKAKWEMTWVVLDHSKIYEYGGIDTSQYSCQAVIDLRFASVREGRDTDRRFVFEVISAKEGRRLYQATSEHDMKMWLYAIANAIESCINGTSTVRTFDDSKLRTASGALDDHALPASRSRPFGLGFPVPATPGNRRSMPPLSEKRTRKTSFKNVLKQSGEKWLNRHSTSTTFDLPRPVPPASAAGAGAGRTTPPPQPQTSASATASPSRHSVKESWDGYDDSHDTAIEQRVYEMAGLGLGDSPQAASSASASAAKRRVQSEGVSRHLSVGNETGMTRSRSADTSAPPPGQPELSMKLLRELADRPGNNRCADCKRPTKASQWATLNLRGVPMVLFLCIRCCGLHRGLGTHISKPRAINLDHWSPESIALACEWGNERGNAIWEQLKPGDLVANDETISTYIQHKYVEGRWLSPADRPRFVWLEGEFVGRAI